MEEALYYFRANVFFRNYKLEGPADRVLLYLTMYISYVLKKLEATSSMEEKKKILQVSVSPFPLFSCNPCHSFVPVPMLSLFVIMIIFFWGGAGLEKWCA